MAEQQDEITAEIAGQKLSLKSVALNTLLTVLTFIAVMLIAQFLWTHHEETKSTSLNFVSALKEQTMVMKEQTIIAREQNCLLSLPQEQRVGSNADLCKRLAR